MRKTILYVAASLDGYIASPDGGLDWLFTDGDYGYHDFFAGIDTLVMGRNTYDVIRSFGEWPYGDKTCYVFAHTADSSGDEHIEFVSAPVTLMMDDLAQQSGGDIWLVGGGELTREFLRHDLIDEFVISIHPVLLGDGIPLFPPGFQTCGLILADTRTYESGLVQLTYDRKRADESGA